MTPLREGEWRFLLAVGQRLVPPLEELDAAGKERFCAIVAAALGERPAAVRRQFRAFLALLRTLPLLRWGRPWRRLGAGRQDRVLRWLQDGAPGRLRQGFWGLKTLVFMGYYGQAELGPRLGYTPVRAGNERLHA